MKLEYENAHQRTGGRCAWDYALFAVCLSVWLFMAAVALAMLVGFVR